MLKNIKRWPGIVNSGKKAFLAFLAWEFVFIPLLVQGQFLPDAILFNAPRSQIWAILALLGAIVFILYGASKDLGEKEDEVKKLTEELKEAKAKAETGVRSFISLGEGARADNWTLTDVQMTTHAPAVPTHQELTQHEISDRVVYLPSLVDQADTEAAIRRSFIRCRIVGPAIVYFDQGTEFAGSTQFLAPRESTVEALLWEKEGKAVGVVRLASKFRDCTFQGIGVADAPGGHSHKQLRLLPGGNG